MSRIGVSVEGSTALYGVVRADTSKTWSPRIHNAAFAAHRIDAVYVPLAVSEEGLASALAGAHALGFRGLNIGEPHKAAAITLCQEIDDVAHRVGAVNTLVRRPLGWYGTNTDALAVEEMLDGAGVSAGQHAIVVGAGGAARASVWALLRCGLTVSITARVPEEADALARSFTGPGVAPSTLSWGKLSEACAGADCIVNATPVAPEGILALWTAPARARQVAVDWVYGACELEEAAKAVGLDTVTGRELLVRQASLAFHEWTGVADADAAMAAALPPRPDPA